MKMHYIAVVTSLYIAVTLASTNIDTYGAGNSDRARELAHSASHGDNRAKASKSLIDHNSFIGQRDRHADAGKKYSGSASAYGQKAAKAAASGNAAAQNFAKQDAKYDDIARQIANVAKVRGYYSASDGKYDKLDHNKAKGFNSAGAKKTKYNKGKVFNDNIEYGFNKDFKQDLHERGGYEEENGHKKHKLDEYKDKQRAHKLIRGDHSAANAREDAQRALKESKYNQNAVQKQAAKGKYGNSEKKLDKAGATQDAQSVLFDRKDSKYTAEDKGQQLAAKHAKEFANKDKKFGRNAAASHGGAQGHDDKKYYGGHSSKDGSGAGGYGGPGGPHLRGGSSGSGGHGEGSGGQANHKYGESAKQIDQGKEHLAQNAGASDQALKKYNQSKKKQDFDQLKSLRDQRKGKFAQGVHNAEKQGFNAKDSHAAKTASGSDKKYADATAKSNAKAAKHDLDEALFDKENYKKRLHDDNENFRKVKKFYHDKKSGGKNIERLLYNRKRVENEFGSAESAQQEKQNQFDKAHKAAKHHAASRKDNFEDVKKASQASGHHNSNRATLGKANSHAQQFKKASHFDNGNKKQIAEADFSNHKDDLKKKQQQFSHKDSNAASIKGNGFKNVNGVEREAKGGPVGGNGINLLSHSPSRRNRVTPYVNHDNINSAPIQDIHVPHDTNRGGNTGYGNANNNNNKPQFNGVHGNNFGKFGDAHKQTGNIHRIGGLFGSGSGSSSYGNRNSHFGNSGNSGSRFGQGNSGRSYGQGQNKFGLFNNFGKSFGSGSGSGSSSSSGSRYGSHTGGRSSSFHSGGLFDSPFGSSFKRPSVFTSHFGFGGKNFKGGLF